jgi:hypothetical protein
VLSTPPTVQVAHLLQEDVLPTKVIATKAINKLFIIVWFLVNNIPNLNKSFQTTKLSVNYFGINI